MKTHLLPIALIYTLFSFNLMAKEEEKEAFFFEKIEPVKKTSRSKEIVKEPIKEEIRAEEDIDILLESPEKLEAHVTRVAQETFKNFLLTEKGMSFPDDGATFDDIVLGTLKSQGKYKLVREYKQILRRIISKAKRDQLLYKEFQNYQLDNMVKTELTDKFLDRFVKKSNFDVSEFDNNSSKNRKTSRK